MSISELEDLRHAIALGDASQETRDKFERALGALEWPESVSAPTANATPSPLTAKSKPGQEFLSKEVTQLTVELELHLSHVPLALVHAFKEEQDPIASVRVFNDAAQDRRISVRSWVEGYSATSVTTSELGVDQHAEVTVPILPTFFEERLTASHPLRATLHVEVRELDATQSGDRLEEHRTVRLWLLPRTTTVLWQKDATTGKTRDFKQHLVSWVTPDAAAVTKVLRDCAARVKGGRIVSYQQSSSQVEAQVQSFFEELKAMGLSYVNSVVATGAANAYLQRVRLPAESLANRSANCVDGAVLYASLLEAASLRSALVIVPGHAFVAWRSSRETTAKGPKFGPWAFLETTMTASDSFAAARARGEETFAQQDKLKRAQVLDVQQLQAEGFLPIS